MKNSIILSNQEKTVNNFVYKKRKFIYSLSFLMLVFFSGNTLIGQNNKVSNTADAIQQTFSLKGTVYSKSDNMTLPGTSILLKNSIIGTESDLNGNFEISNLKEGDVLVFNFMGHESKELIVKQSPTPIKVQMVEGNFTLVGAVDTKTAYTTKRSMWQRVKSIF